MDERLKVALGATVIAAIFAFGPGGNWLVFLVLISMACRGAGVRVSLAPFNRSPASGWVFLLPMRGDDSARCPVLVQKDEALQALCAHLAKGSGLGT